MTLLRSHLSGTWQTGSGEGRPLYDAVTGEEACEYEGLNETQCLAVGCCMWDGAECWSDVGNDPCSRRLTERSEGRRMDDEGYGGYGGSTRQNMSEPQGRQEQRERSAKRR